MTGPSRRRPDEATEVFLSLRATRVWLWVWFALSLVPTLVVTPLVAFVFLLVLTDATAYGTPVTVSAADAVLLLIAGLGLPAMSIYFMRRAIEATRRLRRLREDPHADVERLTILPWLSRSRQ